MLKEERQSMILEIINLRNKIRSVELSQHLNVSEDTIRRDLRELAEGGFIKKVHGGALANPKTPEAVHRRGSGPVEEVQLIAQKANALIREGQVIILDGGPAAEPLVELVPEELSLTIFTNSILAADRLADLPAIDTVLLGGKMSGRSRITYGMDVINVLKDIRADLCLINVSSIQSDIGLTGNNREVAMTKKAMIQSAVSTAGLCLSENIGRIQPFRIVGIDELNLLITELSPESRTLDSLKNKGASLL